MSTIAADFRSAARSLTRSRQFAIIAITFLALGIGLNTALFSIVNAVLIRSLPYHESDRLVEIWSADARRGSGRVPGPFLDALRLRARTLSGIAIHGPMSGALRTDEGPVDVRGERVSDTFFDVLGVRPARGGTFPTGSNALGIIVSHRFWLRYLGGKPNVVGTTIDLDTLPFSVLGVMPPEFKTTFAEGTVDFWTTFVPRNVRSLENSSGYELIGRLAPGVSLDASRAELAAVTHAVSVPGFGAGGRHLGMHPLKQEIVRDAGFALKLLSAAVFIVLAIVCANLAMLLLARSDERLTEFVTRKALGASRTQLLRLAMAESLIIGAAGGVAGIALARIALSPILSLAPTTIPRIGESSLDGRVLVVSLALTLLTVLAFGMTPALRMANVPIADAMRRHTGRHAAAGSRSRLMLVTAQVAASVALCILATLVCRTFLSLVPTDSGFDGRTTAVFSLVLRESIYPAKADRLSRWNELARRVSEHAAIESVALATDVPFSGDESETPVRLANADPTTADYRAVSPSYFSVIGMPVVAGTTFTDRDDDAVLVNETLARRLAVNGSVLGQRITVGRSQPREFRVVGIVGNARSTATTAAVRPEVYVSFASTSATFAYVVVRSRANVAQLSDAFRQATRAVLPELPIRDADTARSMDDLVRRALAAPRFLALLGGVLAATTLVLTAFGVFGLIAYAASQRRTELGIRSALGATPRSLILLVVRSATASIGVGSVVGLLAATYLTRFVATQLYGVSRFDPASFAVAVATMLVVAALSALIPARDAAIASPMNTLRG